MKKTKIQFNQSGMTLLEVLAALVLLGILFMAVSSLFPQMASINQRADIKLDTMNLAMKELSSLKATNMGSGRLTLDRIEAAMPELTAVSTVKTGTTIKPIWTYQKNGYVYALTVNLTEDREGMTKRGSLKGWPFLYKAKVTAMSSEQKQASHAYTYLEVSAQ